MISGWFQSSDYSSQDYNQLNETEALEKLNAIDIQAENQKLKELIDSKEDWCPFGLGLNYDDGYSFHAFREKPDVDEYTVRLERPAKTTLLGLIKIDNPQEKFLEDTPFEKVKDTVSTFFKDRDSLFTDD